MSKPTKASKTLSRFQQIERDLARVLNRHSVDNDFNVPDYILARYLMRHLKSLMDLNHELYRHRFGDVPGHNQHPATTAAECYAGRGEDVAALSAADGGE